MTDIILETAEKNRVLTRTLPCLFCITPCMQAQRVRLGVPEAIGQLRTGTYLLVPAGHLRSCVRHEAPEESELHEAPEASGKEAAFPPHGDSLGDDNVTLCS